MNAEWAASIASAAHLGQKDKAGNPLMWHLADVAAIVNGKGLPDLYEVVAWLHDLYEDGEHAGRVMAAETVSYSIGAALPYVRALTRVEGERYFDYIKRVKAHSKIAVSVKMADIEDHLNKRDSIPSSLIKRYEKALKILAA